MSGTSPPPRHDRTGIVRALLRRNARGLYVVVFAVVVAATAAAAALLVAASDLQSLWSVMAGFLAIPLGTFYAGPVARRIVTPLVAPVGGWLPRVATDGTVPREWRTLVVIPAIVATPERVHELLLRLARLAREHDDPNVRFALLADFADAPSGTTAADAEVLREEERLVARLNAELGDASGDRLFVLHRRRTWYPADGQWIGWERKRGKLLELHRLLLGHADTGYRWTFGDFAEQLDAGGFPYVFTLDEANWLPRGQLMSVLRAASHPANRARLDEESGRLVGGYAIFQPVVVPTLAGNESMSLAPRAVGQDSAVMQFYFDALGVGVFQGKGLLDVRACHALLDDAFPPGIVLQHDVLEGFVAHTARVHDAFVLEAQAPGYLSQVRRGHRWLRGFFQMLPWVFPRTRDARGVSRPNPLRIIHRSFILELVLPELARPASLLLLLTGWLALREHVVAWTILVCPALAVLLARLAATGVMALAHGLRGLRAASPAAHPSPSLRQLAFDGFAAIIAQATLPYEAIMVADALGRASWRMLVTRRHLLDWPPVRRAQAAARVLEPREYRRALWVCGATGLLTLAGVSALRPAHLLVALPFAVVWIAAPWLVAWLDGALLDPGVERPLAAAAHDGIPLQLPSPVP